MAVGGVGTTEKKYSRRHSAGRGDDGEEQEVFSGAGEDAPRAPEGTEGRR